MFVLSLLHTPVDDCVISLELQKKFSNSIRTFIRSNLILITEKVVIIGVKYISYYFDIVL